MEKERSQVEKRAKAMEGDVACLQSQVRRPLGEPWWRGGLAVGATSKGDRLMPIQREEKGVAGSRAYYGA